MDYILSDHGIYNETFDPVIVVTAYFDGYVRLDKPLLTTNSGSSANLLAQTATWYQAWKRGADMAAISLDQIRAYETAAQA